MQDGRWLAPETRQSIQRLKKRRVRGNTVCGGVNLINRGIGEEESGRSSIRRRLPLNDFLK
jgi:hypothetical protein